MAYRMSGAGRLQHIVGGLLLVALAAFDIGAPWTWIGIVPLTAGVIGWCPFPALRAHLTKKRRSAPWS